MSTGTSGPVRPTGLGGVGRLLAAPLCFTACFVIAILAALVSRVAWRPSGALVPWGLVLAVSASVAAVLLARAASRFLGWAAAFGWILGLLVVLAGRPEGDYVLAADALGETFLVAGPIAVLVSAGWGTRTAPSSRSVEPRP